VLIVVLVPTIALQALAWREVRRQRDTATSAAMVSKNAEVLEYSGRLIVPLYLELAITSGITQTEADKVSRSALFKDTGFDFLALLKKSRADLDAAMSALDAHAGSQAVGTSTVHEQVTSMNKALAPIRKDFDDGTAIDPLIVRTKSEKITEQLDELNKEISNGMRSSATTDELIAITAESGQSLATLEYAAEHLDHLAESAISATPQASLIAMIDSEGALKASLDQLRSLISTDRRAPLDSLTTGGAFKAVAGSLSLYVDAITLAAQQGATIERASQTEQLLVGVMQSTVTRLGEVQQYVDRFILEETTRSRDVVHRAHRSEIEALVVMITTLLISLVLLALVMRSILRPLGRLTRQSRNVRAGDLSIEAEKPTGPTDLRVVTRAFNDMLTTLKAYESQLDRLAQGDTKVDETLPGPLGETVRRSVSQLATLTAQLHASEAAANRQARMDALTGLANRTAALERLAIIAMQARQFHRQGAIIFLDLDGFKSVNDTQGHAEGDRILTEIADRLRDACPQDVVARIGGDEFLVLVQNAPSIEAITARAAELIAVVSEPCTGSGGQLFTLSASAGVALIDGFRDPLDCIAQADTAVYHAKERGRGRVEAFDDRLTKAIEERAEMALTMRHGLTAGQFFLCLQPIIDVATMHPVGAEVLLRWNRPGIGEVGPNDFIPIAERTGVIVDLETWVLEQTVGILREWRLDPTTSRMRLAVNISGRHIVEGNLATLLDALCRQANIDPSLIDLEITETHLVADIARASSVVDDLRSQGVNVAIDDFGTGYSSMSYLHRLTVDTLKIDQVFVAGMCDDRLDLTIVELLLRLGDSLNLNVVAEGVDSEDKLALLKELNCPWAQGFYIARPMPVDDCFRWLRQQEALASSLR
jgi:diguanylate cyclase (GGDEF)-like protein